MCVCVCVELAKASARNHKAASVTWQGRMVAAQALQMEAGQPKSRVLCSQTFSAALYLPSSKKQSVPVATCRYDNGCMCLSNSIVLRLCCLQLVVTGLLLQVTIAEQLGLKPSTVSNFFMNARRRSIDKYREDDDMGDESAAVAASPASPLATPFSPRATPLELLATPTSSLASPISLLTLPTASGLDAPSINLVTMPTNSLAMSSSSAPVCLKTEAK
jgi:hypothetical protein